PTVSGRTGYLAPVDALAMLRSEEAPLPLDTANLRAILATQVVEQTRAPATLFVGPAGSGKTWHLKNYHPHQRVERRIYVDLSQPQRQALVQLVEAAGAVAPPRVTIPQLAEMSALALQSTPTLLLLDNVDRATEKAIATIDPLIDAVAECALAAKTPKTPAEQRKLAPLVARVAQQEIKPLGRAEALSLARNHLPDQIVDPQATERRILELGKGHPGTIVDLATRTQRGTLEEVRHYASNQVAPINLGWILLFPIFFLLLLWRADGYLIAALSMLAIMVLRRLLFRQLLR
ncbi:MAG: ATP-binding protein, partial [Caldilineaceae bacterium]|nr:ATP-binding protein [Caldilineaceae bacterium]